jgi:hypothetical protein
MLLFCTIQHGFITENEVMSIDGIGEDQPFVQITRSADTFNIA